MDKTIIQLLHEISDDVCDNFCRYQETVDNEGVCDWVRNGEKCPLDVIN